MDILLTTMVTLSVALSFINQWNLSRGNLKVLYPMIIVLAVLNIVIDFYVGFAHPEQLSFLLYTFGNMWAMLMATQGLARLKKEKKCSNERNI